MVYGFCNIFLILIVLLLFSYNCVNGREFFYKILNRYFLKFKFIRYYENDFYF